MTKDAEQKFSFERDSRTGYYRIKSGKTQYLSLAKHDDSYSLCIQLQDYSSDNLSQLWELEKMNDGSVAIKAAVNTGYSLDVSGGSSADGTPVQLYASNGTASQRFYLLPSAPDVEGGRTVADGVYVFRSALDDSKALDVAGGSAYDGANVQLYASNGTDAQRFRVSLGGDGLYAVEALGSGKALDVDGGGLAVGSNVQQWGANGTDSQKWAIRANGDGSYTLVSKCNGLALDVSGGSAYDGANVQCWTDNGTASQRFYLLPSAPDVEGGRTVADGVYVFRSALDDSKALDVAGGSAYDGANVQLYASNGTDAQRFRVSLGGDGLYAVEALGSGKALDVDGGGLAVGSNVQQWGANGTDSQKWAIRANGDGSYTLVSKCNGLALDVSGGSAYDGANVQCWTDNGTASQRFYLSSF
ncbi:RICIN domain-containing protein [Ellagibacter isourolithinifaciens]|uniref:RICIN domain-containing protein n=1 Tax=Ellagibacter isourolithinifaciens TaxID=2137581 RepID=UPI003F890FC0